MQWRSNSEPEYNKGVSDSLGPTRCSGYFISAVERAVHFKQSDLEGWVCSGNFSLLVFWLFIYGDVLCLGGWKASLPSPSSLASILWKWTELSLFCHRVRSCSSSGKRCAVWGTVSRVMTPSITPWTLWSRAWPASWTDSTLWTTSGDRRKEYEQLHTLALKWLSFCFVLFSAGVSQK